MVCPTGPTRTRTARSRCRRRSTRRMPPARLRVTPASSTCRVAGTSMSTSRPPELARRGRPAAIAVTGVALAAVAGFGARGLWSGGPHQAATAAVPVASAVVVRTDLSARQPVAGTLGYLGFFTVVSETDGGLLTWLPAPGDVVRRGRPLFA